MGLAAATGSEERALAATELRAMGTNAVPLLIAEMPKIRRMREDPSSNIVHKALELETALNGFFESMGTNLLPFASELRREFLAGNASGTAAHALARLGGDHAEFVVASLQHTSSKVRLGAASAVRHIQDPILRTNAVAPLVLLLNEERPMDRVMVLAMIGGLRIAPEKVLPALLETLEHDPVPFVRLAAWKAINDFGTNAVLIESGLERVLSSTTDANVKAIVNNILKNKLKDPHRNN